MEDYIKEAPQKVSPSRRMEQQRRKQEARKAEEVASKENGKREDEVGKKAAVPQEKPVSEAQQNVDLLGLHDESPMATQSEESNNSLALTICQPAVNEERQRNDGTNEFGNGCGWELALVTTPSTTNSPQTKVGGFDKLLLDSLYEDGASRRQLQLHRAGYSTDSYGYGTSPHNVFDHRGVASPMMMMMSPQQQMAVQQRQQHQMMMQQQQQQYQQMMM